MSDDSEELLTGREGNEAAQGWSPMVSADPVPSGDELPNVDPITEDDLSHLKRPAPPEPVERAYYNIETGEEVPEHQSVTAEQAGHDLKTIREQEAKQIDDAAREALSAALDGTEQQPDQPQPETFEPQPELPPDTSAQDDAEIQRLLQNPVLRERVAKEYAQMSAVADYAKNHYTTAATQLSQQVDSLLITSFPELQPFLGNQAQMAGALKMLQEQNPSRWAELQNFTQRAAIVTEHAQRAAQEQRAVVQQRQQEEFQNYAREQDAKAFANTPPAELAQIRNYLYEEGQRAGFSREEINQHWGNNVALRNAHVSELLADGVRYRMAKQGISAQRHNPLKPVMRPGVSESGPSDNSDYASLERQFRGKDLNPKQAADLLIAHRARR
jgi:hypothetical protein